MNIPMKLHKQNVARGPKGQAWAPRWWGILLIGLVLWAATAADVFVTGNLIVLPSVVLLGSFLVPVMAVVWYLDHNPSPGLSPRPIGAAFVVAGLVRVLVSSGLGVWLGFGPGGRGGVQ